MNDPSLTLVYPWHDLNDSCPRNPDYACGPIRSTRLHDTATAYSGVHAPNMTMAPSVSSKVAASLPLVVSSARLHA